MIGGTLLYISLYYPIYILVLEVLLNNTAQDSELYG